ncbi:MAG: M20/M25/M40 family metallo-hydrolase [Betaproteobacteria bacterium]|jgi:acetylornithine deacetylase/succinyl-diaminopimelate desuccinylase-like protein|nr:M20/M25/M40 family metallo-hydrolase [Betaproteobacteria bacterium]
MRQNMRTLLCIALFATTRALAQGTLPPIPQAVDDAYARIIARGEIGAAMDSIREAGVRMFEEQIRINEIPAPPFKEQMRAEYYLMRMRELGLPNARIDKEGNVIGIRPGSGNGPKLVVSAHLDTVFPEGTDVKVREKDGRFYAPGIYDDALGLTNLLILLETMNKHDIRTVGDVIFVGTVGEEELGDLRGVKALFREMKDIDGFISLDGVGLGRIVNQATGSHRYLATFSGQGGHSFSAFGLPSAIHAMGRAVAKIGDLVTPDDPKTTFTVGTVSGGTSVNAIAADSTIGIDIRSNSNAALLEFENKLPAALEEAANEENARWKASVGNLIRVEIKQVGNRPAGMTPLDSPIVAAARASLPRVGARLRSIIASSTDSNTPMSLGIPAITLSSSGTGGGSHSPGEWYSPINNHLGAQNIFLVTVALTGLDGVTTPLLPKRTR